MKYIFSFSMLIFLLLSSSAGSSQTSVANLFDKQLYYGLDNPLSVMIEGYKCNEISMTADTGSLMKVDYCNYTYRPITKGNVRFSVYATRSGKKIKLAQYLFRVRELPRPHAFIGIRQGGEISRRELRAMQGIRAELPRDFPLICTGGIQFTIDSFSLVVSRNNQVILHHVEQGQLFSDLLNNKFADLQAGDKLLFYSMKYNGPDGTHILEPVEFVIVE